MLGISNRFARKRIQADHADQRFLGGAIHLFMRGETVDAMANAGRGNCSQCLPGTLVRAGCNQAIGARCQPGARDSGVSDDPHAQSMAESIQASKIATAYSLIRAINSPTIPTAYGPATVRTNWLNSTCAELSARSEMVRTAQKGTA